MAKPKPKPLEAPGDLTPIELAAISVLARSAKDWRKHIAPGQHSVDLVLRLDGTVTAADDQTSEVKKKPTAEQVLVAVFEQLGPKTTLQVAKALDRGLPSDPSLESQATAKVVIESLTQKSEQTRAGNVTGRLNLTRFPSRAARSLVE